MVPMIINLKGRKIPVPVKKVGVYNPGLVFRTRETGNLLFEFKSNSRMAITSCFVFFPFLAVWLDAENRVIDFKIVKPFRFKISSNKPFRRLVEIPINRANMKTINMLTSIKA